MSSEQGVQYCQHRSNVWENLQVADHKVNYYEVPVSDTEEESEADEEHGIIQPYTKYALIHANGRFRCGRRVHHGTSRW